LISNIIAQAAEKFIRFLVILVKSSH